MFGGGSSSSAAKSEPAVADSGKTDKKSPSPDRKPDSTSAGGTPTKSPDQAASGEKRSGNGSPPGRQNPDTGNSEKKRRSSGVGSKASSLIASAKNSLNFSQVGRSNSDVSNHTPLQKLGKQDQSLAVPQGQHNNSAGESLPGPRSTFRVGVWEDRNKKCRRTMEDTHAFLYNFLHTPAPLLVADSGNKSLKSQKSTSEDADPPAESSSQDVIETDNGYFAIFDGHAGTFAADWCGKKLHLILEDIIRRNPNVPIPELLDQTFTNVDQQLEKLPLKNSGCTAAIAVLRWEDRVPSTNSATGSQAIAPAAAAASKATDASKPKEARPENDGPNNAIVESAHARLKGTAVRQRVLYTANVGDARIILCRAGKALRLSYDHKGSDENEGKRIANAGGLILNNRVNGVLAVTRALGDTYMKDLVTGHPYTTETVIQPEVDEFIIIACDGLWDVCNDQDAVDLIRDEQDPATASKKLVDHALARFSTDNLSCMIVRFDKAALLEHHNNKDNPIGVEGDSTGTSGKVSEADRIVSSTKQKIAEGDTPAIGISASNSGRGHDLIPIDDGSDTFKPTIIEGPVEEEPPSLEDSDAPEVTTDAIPNPSGLVTPESTSPNTAEPPSKS
ncbi:PP2C-domain-containing protein [Hypoxylon trugodes]|uniref:PP2C-domain-containing protein n=1 Tax=Hypoxylon trugodes TaxID=326681 RepID=UPI00219645C6|nr:PP2C-domain-containing protein [Hypoxylon trugodes]KAI1393614.1 PP2C-domain-containing protein [Hypoxylon trugodes]